MAVTTARTHSASLTPRPSDLPRSMPASASQPSSATSQATASPVPSASTASLESADGGKFALPPSATAVVNGVNGVNGTVKAAPQPLTPSSTTTTLPIRKPTMTSRISGIFKRGEVDSSRDASREKLVERHSISERPGRDSADSAASSVRPIQPTRQSSITTEKKKKSGSEEDTVPKRFWTTEDGGHEHYLKSARRQQKLSDIFRDMLKKKPHHDADTHQQMPQQQPPLSLLQDWVLQKRNEQDTKANADIKGGPTHTQTLVQKYGKCQEIVGHGAFGIVRVAHKQDEKDPRREQLFAVKEFRQRPGESAKKYQKRLTSEFCISSSMQHPNVIHTLDLLQDDKGDYCEVMEYCAGGDLYTLILSAVSLDMLEADCYFKQLMRGVEYMHDMGVAHRDLKPENLLLTQHGALKITDFGNGECFRMAWEKEAHMTAGLCGSAPYIAPEEYVDDEFDPRAVDIWACGVIYMAMRTGRHLWHLAKKGDDEFFTRYLEDRREESGFRPIEVLPRVSVRSRVVFPFLPMFFTLFSSKKNDTRVKGLEDAENGKYPGRFGGLFLHAFSWFLRCSLFFPFYFSFWYND